MEGMATTMAIRNQKGSIMRTIINVLVLKAWVSIAIVPAKKPIDMPL